MFLILLVVLLFLAAGSGPWYPYSRDWGYTPMSFLVVLLILFVLFGRGRL